jgi:DNA-binding transcriptional LysR family regulator
MVSSDSKVWDLRALRYFLTVAKHSSVTRASVELGVSESAVSQRLKTLEHAMGLKLYESSGGRLRITSTGSRLVEMAIDIFDRIDGYRAELGADQLSGSLTVATQDPVVRYLLPGVARSFAAENPNVRLELMTRTVEETLRLVRLGEADIGIVSETPLPDPLVFHPLRTYQAQFVAPKGHSLFASGTPAMEELLTPETIDRFPLIAPEHGDSTHTHIREALARLGLPYNIALEVGTTETVKHYVGLGLGVAVISGVCITPTDSETLDMVEVPQHFGGTSTYGYVVRREKYLSGPAEAFLTTLRSSVAGSTLG